MPLLMLQNRERSADRDQSALGLSSCSLLHLFRTLSSLGTAGLEPNVVPLKRTSHGLLTTRCRWLQFSNLLIRSLVEKVISLAMVSSTCEAFQAQGFSWLQRQDPSFGLFSPHFLCIKHSAGAQHSKGKGELLTAQIVAASCFSSLFPGQTHGNQAVF